MLYVLNTDPLQTVGPGSFIHQLIEAAGGANIAAGTSTAYPRFALEEVLARDPEVIVFPVGTAEGIPEEEQQQWRRWSSLSAVKHNRLVLVPSVLVDRPGPRIVEGLELLAKAIHPEAFHGRVPRREAMIVHPSPSQTTCPIHRRWLRPFQLRITRDGHRGRPCGLVGGMSVMGLMMLLTCGAIVFCLQFGAQALTHGGAVVCPDILDGWERGVARVIIWDIRFPRILMGLFVGASLAITGAALQALVRNPLADPYVLGISSGAALGATIGLGIRAWHRSWAGWGCRLSAFIGGGLSILLVYGIAASQGRLPMHQLLLAGVIVNAVCSALMMFATSILNPASLYRVVLWLMGTLSAPSFTALIGIGFCTVGAMVLFLRQSHELNLIAVGEDVATSLGVRPYEYNEPYSLCRPS